MGVVVDTSAIVDLERSRGSLADLVGALGAEPAVLPAIVLAELQVGVRLADTPARAARRAAQLASLTSRIPIVDFDREVADEWATIFADLRRGGRPIPANDIAVSATARVLDYDVVVGHRDEAHFRLVPGLRVRTLAV